MDGTYLRGQRNLSLTESKNSLLFKAHFSDWRGNNYKNRSDVHYFLTDLVLHNSSDSIIIYWTYEMCAEIC